MGDNNHIPLMPGNNEYSIKGGNNDCITKTAEYPVILTISPLMGGNNHINDNVLKTQKGNISSYM